MLKPKEVEEAFGLAVANIKRQKRMENMRYPLLDKKGYRIYLYFTITTGSAYTQIIKFIINRKKGKIVKAAGLFCFQFNYKNDAWFINEISELAEYIQVLFSDYYKKYVEPELKKVGYK